MQALQPSWAHLTASALVRQHFWVNTSYSGWHPCPERNSKIERLKESCLPPSFLSPFCTESKLLMSPNQQDSPGWGLSYTEQSESFLPQRPTLCQQCPGQWENVHQICSTWKNRFTFLLSLLTSKGSFSKLRNQKGNVNCYHIQGVKYSKTGLIVIHPI